MRILITGASSSLAVGVTRQLLQNSDAEIWCCRHRTEIPISDDRVHVIDFDLESDFASSLSVREFDTVIHFAGATHAVDENEYWKLNTEATRRLAREVHKNGCRNFVYMSTRCATTRSGAYGESKLAAEQGLQKRDWKSLLIVRPSEVYGGNGREGIDRMLSMAPKWRIVPALYGNSDIQFAPLHIDDFARLAAELILRQPKGVHIEDLCGPEDLSGVMLARRISRRYGAVPIPLWWPLAVVTFKALHTLGFSVVKPDQIKRLSGQKTATAESSATKRAGLRRFLI
jgi:nucleoside-diphosphate-sugar epimerase